MFTNWLHQIARQKEDTPPATPPGITTILPAYEQALRTLNGQEPETLLAVLLLRDQVEAIRQQDTAPAVSVMQQLIRLDEQLRQRVTAVFLPSLSRWRKSVRPPQAHWWWYLDEAAKEKEQEKDFLWHILAVTFFILTVPLATDIIRRLWAHAPDNIAIVSTLLTLLITASPFTKNGRELMQWLLRHFPRLSTRRQPQAMVITALLAFLFVGVLYFVYIPNLALIYNAQGVAAFHEGQLATAQQKLQRAIALRSDLSTSYYNLAEVYKASARYNEAFDLYQQTLNHDPQHVPAYLGLGQIYLQRGEPVRSQDILSKGLLMLDGTEVESQTRLVMSYRLLTYLGQAYYEQEQFELAALTLEEAVALERSEGLAAGFFTARPHVYLARSYEALTRPSADIVAQWEAALSYLSADDPSSWQLTIAQQLRHWRENN